MYKLVLVLTICAVSCSTTQAQPVGLEFYDDLTTCRWSTTTSSRITFPASIEREEMTTGSAVLTRNCTCRTTAST